MKWAGDPGLLDLGSAETRRAAFRFIATNKILIPREEFRIFATMQSNSGMVRGGSVVLAGFMLAIAAAVLFVAWPTKRTESGSAPPEESAPIEPDVRAIESVPVELRAAAGKESSRIADGISGAPVESRSASVPAANTIISGIVTNEVGRPLAGARVSALRTNNGNQRTRHVDYSGVRRIVTLADENGCYRLAALEPGADYEIHAEHPEPFQSSFGAENPESVAFARPPQSNVNLAVILSGLDLEIIPPPGFAHILEHGSEPEAKLTLEVFQKGQMLMASSLGGKLRQHYYIKVDPDYPLSLALEVDGMRPVEMEGLAFLKGEGVRRMPVQLEAWPGNRVTLIVRDAAGAAVPKLQIQDITKQKTFDLSGSIVGPGTQGDSGNPGPVVADGEHTLRNLKPGSRTLRLTPSLPCLALPQTVVVEVPDKGSVKENVVLALGGVLRLEIHTEIGDLPTFELVPTVASRASSDTSGRGERLMELEKDEPDSSVEGHTTHLFYLKSNRALLPGKHTLRAPLDPPREFPVEIFAGRETLLKLEL